MNLCLGLVAWWQYFFIYLNDILAHYSILVSIMPTHVYAPLFIKSHHVFFLDNLLLKIYMVLHGSNSYYLYVLEQCCFIISYDLWACHVYYMLYSWKLFVNISYLCCGIVCFYYSFLVWAYDGCRPLVFQHCSSFQLIFDCNKDGWC